MSWLLLVFWGYIIPCDEKGVESVAGKLGQDMTWQVVSSVHEVARCLNIHIRCNIYFDFSVICAELWKLNCTFIHVVVCLMTGPKPLPKWALHIVRSNCTEVICMNWKNWKKKMVLVFQNQCSSCFTMLPQGSGKKKSKFKPHRRW